MKLSRRSVIKVIPSIVGPILLLVLGAILGPLVSKHFNPETKVHYFVAQSSTKLAERSDVWCFPSAMLDRPEARRCSKTSKIYDGQFIDPCFLAVDKKTVECPDAPHAEREEYKYNPGSGYGAGPAPSWFETLKETPWFMYLKNGADCRIDKEPDEYALGKIDFVCSDGTKVILPVNTKEKLWEVRCVKETDGHIEQCGILEIWL